MLDWGIFTDALTSWFNVSLALTFTSAIAAQAPGHSPCPEVPLNVTNTSLILSLTVIVYALSKVELFSVLSKTTVLFPASSIVSTLNWNGNPSFSNTNSIFSAKYSLPKFTFAYEFKFPPFATHKLLISPSVMLLNGFPFSDSLPVTSFPNATFTNSNFSWTGLNALISAKLAQAPGNSPCPFFPVIVTVISFISLSTFIV